MLDIQLIRENTAAVKEAVRRKKFQVDIDELLEVDKARLAVLADCEQLRAQRNEVSARIPKMQGEEKQAAIADMRAVRETLGERETSLRDLEIRFETLMLSVPGLPVEGIPDGTGDEDNVEVRRVGELPSFDFDPLDHVTLCKNLGLADFERAARFAGGRSYLLTGAGAMLEYAVTRFAMDHLMTQGFTPVVAPLLVSDKAMVGTGFFPLGREDTYAMEKDELYLVGTSEVPLCSIHREEILDAERHALQGPGLSCGDSFVGFGRHLQRPFRGFTDIGVKHPRRFDVGYIRLGKLACRERLVGETVADFGDGQGCQIAHIRCTLPSMRDSGSLRALTQPPLERRRSCRHGSARWQRHRRPDHPR